MRWGEAWLKKGLLSSKSRDVRRLARRSTPDPRGPCSDAALGGHDVRAAAQSAVLEGFKVWPALRCRADVRMGVKYESARYRGASCITETAAAHSLQFGTYACRLPGCWPR